MSPLLFRRALAIALPVLIIGCGVGVVGGNSQTPDAGTVPPEDASVEVDAGSDEVPDAGEPDAGTEDAGEVGGEDAGVTPDAGEGGDGGTLPPPVPSAGCQSTTQLSEGPGTLTVGTATREYIVRLPANYTTSRAWPVVFALHPNGSNNTYWDQTSGDRNIRGLVKDHAILILPEARTGDWRTEEEVDLTYFDQLITRVKSQLCVDTGRIFSMGFSGGGSYSGMLGCRRTDIRAIAAGGAVTYFDPNDCVGTPAAWITIGTQELISARAAFRDYWRDRNMCSATTTATAPPPCVAYACPLPDRPVHYCEHPGGHIWPSFGTGAVWAFFSQF